MKKLLIILSTSALLASSASARHMVFQDNGETATPKSSPQTLMTFY
jgi:hypothetical protein